MARSFVEVEFYDLFKEQEMAYAERRLTCDYPGCSAELPCLIHNPTEKTLRVYGWTLFEELHYCQRHGLAAKPAATRLSRGVDWFRRSGVNWLVIGSLVYFYATATAFLFGWTQ
jgi:hypothetical protein